jgi:hypothetical protein
VAGQWFLFPSTPVFSTNKTNRHNITKILLKAALNTIKDQPTHLNLFMQVYSTELSLPARRDII